MTWSSLTIDYQKIYFNAFDYEQLFLITISARGCSIRWGKRNKSAREMRVEAMIIRLKIKDMGLNLVLFGEEIRLIISEVSVGNGFRESGGWSALGIANLQKKSWSW